MSNKTVIYNILLTGLIMRLILGTFSINWDFLKITQITAKLHFASFSELYSDPLSLYPILTYLTRFILIILSQPFIGSEFWQWNQLGDLAAISDPRIFRYLFFLKLPFVLIELATAFILSALIKPDKRSKFLAVWMLNPIAIFAITLVTNVDVFPIFFIALSFRFFTRKNINKAAFFLGIASAYKFFPILIFPFILLNIKKIREMAIACFWFIIPFTLTQLPGLFIANYWKNSIFAGTNRIILTGVIDIGNGKLLILFVFLYLLILFRFLNQKNKSSFTAVYFLPIAPIFILSAFNIQWLYWILPFMILFQVKSLCEAPIFFIFYFSFFGLIIFSQTSMNIGMLAPIDITLWTYDWNIAKILGREANLAVNFFYTSISACVTFIVYRLLNGSESKEK